MVIESNSGWTYMEARGWCCEGDVTPWNILPRRQTVVHLAEVPSRGPTTPFPLNQALSSVMYYHARTTCMFSLFLLLILNLVAIHPSNEETHRQISKYINTKYVYGFSYYNPHIHTQISRLLMIVVPRGNANTIVVIIQGKQPFLFFFVQPTTYLTKKDSHTLADLKSPYRWK